MSSWCRDDSEMLSPGTHAQPRARDKCCAERSTSPLEVYTSTSQPEVSLHRFDTFLYSESDSLCLSFRHQSSWRRSPCPRPSPSCLCLASRAKGYALKNRKQQGPQKKKLRFTRPSNRRVALAILPGAHNHGDPSSFVFFCHCVNFLLLLRQLLAETNPIILVITVVVSILHSVFNFLAFKNDISFWRNKKK